MCGRFTQKLTWREIHDLHGLLTTAPSDNMRPRWNGAPTQDFAARRLNADGVRTLSRLRWELIPFWAKDAKIGSRLINARAESVDSKPAFQSAFKSRRCLVPADGWFESVREGGGKSPRFLSMADGSIASFAALWERWVRHPHPGPYGIQPVSSLVNNVRNDGPEVLGQTERLSV